MLSRENRLARKDDFNSVHKKGQFFADKFLAMRILPNGLEKSRIGFLVGLKISKKAVDRNIVKRRLREIFQAKIKDEKLKKGFDVIVMVRPEIVEKDYIEIKEAVEEVLGKAKLIL